MKRFLLALLCALIPLTAYAQTPSQPAAKWVEVPYQTAVKSELDKVFNGLANQLKVADTLVAQLKSTAAKTPEDTQTAINGAAQVLSNLADKTAANGDLASQLLALRNAAGVHRKRVQDMAKGTIEEADRTNILTSWDQVVQEADKAQAAMADMHQRLLDVLNTLRMRQVAVSEFMLAGQYRAAVGALRGWLGELETAVLSLHKVIDPVNPARVS